MAEVPENFPLVPLMFFAIFTQKLAKKHKDSPLNFFQKTFVDENAQKIMNFCLKMAKFGQFC